MRINYRLIIFTIVALISSNIALGYDLSEYPSPFIKNNKFNGIIVVGDKAPAEDIITISDIILSLQYPALGANPESIMGLDTLMENQTRTYTIKGVDYEVTLNFIDSNSAQFIINGMTTNVLSTGESDTLLDLITIGLLDTFVEDNTNYATFFFANKKIKVEKIEVETGGAKLASEVDDIKSVNSILIGHACENPLILEARGVSEDCKTGYKQGIGSIEAYEFPNGKVSVVITGHSTNDTFNAAQILRFHGYYKPFLRGSKIDVIAKNGKLVTDSYVESKKNFKATPSKRGDFDEADFKLGISAFVILILVFVFLSLGKRFKRKH